MQVYYNSFTIISICTCPQGQVHQFNLTIASCPAGHSLHSIDVDNETDEYSCRCNEDRDQNIISCPHEGIVVLKVQAYYHTTTVMFYCRMDTGHMQ